MSDKYEEYYKDCGRMFEASITRILDDPDHTNKQKASYMRKIHYYIDKASEKRFDL